MFEDYTGSKNSKVEGVALILKTLEEQSCYKAIVMFKSTYVRTYV